MVDERMNLSMETNRTDGGNLRRFSMGKASLSSIDEQSISRRSSTGSCHDFCKYGHKHLLETKAKVPLLKRAMKKSFNGQNSDLVVAMPAKEKPPVRVTKLKASPDLGTCITDGTDVVKRVVHVNTPTRRSPVEIEVMNESKKRVVPVNSPTRRSSIGIEVMNENKKRVFARRSSIGIEVMNENKERVFARRSSIGIEVRNENKERVFTRRSSIGIEVMNENRERVAAVTSPSRQSSVEIEVTSENKEQAVPVNSSSRQSSIEIEVMNESKKHVVPVNSPTGRNSIGIEVMDENKERVVAVTSPSRQSPVEIEVMNESEERIVPVNSSSRQSPIEIEVMNERKKRVVPINSPTRRSSIGIEVMNGKKERVTAVTSPSRRSSVEIEAMNESKEPVAKTQTLLKAHRPKIHKQVVFSSKKSESFSKPSLTNTGEARFLRINSLLKPKTSKEKSMTFSGSSGNIAVHRNNSSETGEGSRTSKQIGTKMAGNPVAMSDPISVDAVGNLPAIKNKTTRVISRVVTQKKTRRAQTKEALNVESQEKTLYVINMETKKTKVVESDQNEKHGLELCPKQPSSPYKSSSLANFPTKYTRSKANTAFSGPNKHGGIKISRSPRMLITKGKDSSSLNLSFKNGKAVDLHSENPSPRRLKFTRGRSFGDNQKSKDGQRTSFKKAVNKGIAKDSIPSSEKVVLRHQDVQGKKDTEVSFNKVIAETARTLVRTRKGKVKALVGAFEKVISLQDKKPSPRTTA